MKEVIKKKKDLVNGINRKQDAREHLANERTLLAWIRTSIGIMAFGFVVVKFSLFIKQISLLIGENIPLPPQHRYSSMIGILLVIVGAVVLSFSYIKYKQTEKQLNDEAFKSSSKLIFSLIIVIFLISILLILYLLENTSSS